MSKYINNILRTMPFLFATVLLSSCGGDGDNTVENWFFAILFLLACLKRG